MQHILVTGASGFLGKSVVNYLKSKNLTLRATGRNLEQLKTLNIKDIHAVDLTKVENLDFLFEGCLAVVHCAALSSPWGTKKQFIDINVNVTQKLAKHALKFGVKKFVHISSPSIYIGMSKKENIKEEDPLPKNFINYYAKTKYLAEVLLDNFVKQGLPCVILRPQALFGPEDTVLMPRFLKANTKTGIPLFSGGEHRLDLTYVENVAHAVYLALNADKQIIGQKFNITNHEPIIFKNFVENFFKYIDEKPNFKTISLPAAHSFAYILETYHKILKPHQEPLLTRYTIKVLSESRTLNNSKAIHLLSYKPVVSMEQGLQLFAKWWCCRDKSSSVS